MFKVFTNKQILAFAKNPPHSWERLRGVHPLVRQQAASFRGIVDEAKQHEEYLPIKDKKKITLEQHQGLVQLREQRNTLAEKIGIKPHLLLREEQMYDIMATNSLDSLRHWQREMIGDLVRKMQHNPKSE